MQRLIVSAMALAVVTAFSSLSHASFLYDDPSKVNLLQADNIAISATHTSGGSAMALRTINDDNLGWDSGSIGAGNKSAITIDFKEVRNVTQIQTYCNFASYQINSATIEYSNDGVSWSTVGNTLSVDALKQRVQINLASAVDTRYLRVTGDTYQNGPGGNELGRWYVVDMRVLGAPSSLDAGWHLDVVSRSALSNGVTLTRDVGTVNITDVNDAQFVDDAYSPIKRQVMYSMGTGDGFTLHWDREIAMHEFAFNASSSGVIDPNAAWQLEGWTGAGTPQLIMTHTGQASGYNLFSLPSYFVGDTFRFTYTSTTSSDNRISDIQVFVPEPASASLVMVGLVAVMRRRRRAQALR